MRSISTAGSSSESWKKPALKAITDMNAREIAIMAPLVILTIFFGFYPAFLLDVMAVSVKQLVANFETATAAAEAARAALAAAQ
jgi:NADH-quinone oxidoreductase subunit M